MVLVLKLVNILALLPINSLHTWPESSLGKIYDSLHQMYGEALHRKQDPDPDPHLKLKL